MQINHAVTVTVKVKCIKHDEEDQVQIIINIDTRSDNSSMVITLKC